MSERQEMIDEVAFLVSFVITNRTLPDKYGYFTAEKFKKDFAMSAYPIDVIMLGMLRAWRQNQLTAFWRIECQKCGTVNYIEEESLERLTTATRLEEGVIPCDYCANGLSIDMKPSDGKRALYYAAHPDYQSEDYFANTELVVDEREFEEMKQEPFLKRLLPKWLTRIFY